jgi:hypothetical protein
VYLGAMGSIALVFRDHNLSHSIKLVFFDGPYSSINSFIASIVRPLLIIP